MTDAPKPKRPRGNPAFRAVKGTGAGPAKGAGQGVGQGDGWGGAAKGKGKPARAFTAEDRKAAPFTGSTDGRFPPSQATLTAAEKAATLRDHLYHLALNAEREETQVTAARAYLDRVEGTPVQRIVNHDADDISALSDEALAARQEELARALREGAGGGTSPAGEAQPHRVVN